MDWLRGVLGTGPLEPIQEHQASTASTTAYAVGSIVEYYSVTSQSWIPAKVLAMNANGTYDLDCKPQVQVTRMRPGASAGASASVGAKAGYEVGSVVEYFSASQGTWIPARVLGYDPTNGYNLDCKPNVQPDKIRHLTPGTAEALRTSDNLQRSDAGPSANSSALGLTGGEQVPTFSNFSPAQREVPAGTMTAVPAATAPATMPATSPATQPVTATMPKLDVSTLPPPAEDAPVQLVSVSRREDKWHFEVTQEGQRALEAYGTRPVTICTVCGPYRSGKSYLLNLLLGRVQRGASQFKVGHTAKACTEGIWMWGSGEKVGQSGSALVFMDCEGFGSTDADRTRDAKLMSLCLLLSSVFLLNTKGVLNEGLFNALSLVCHLAEHVEERGSEASKPAMLWLLRDFVLELRDPERDDHELTPDEYLERALHAKPLAGGNAERSAAAREVRECLLRFFPKRHCATLVQPIVDEEKLGNLAEVPYSELRPEFRREFEVMRAQLLELARERHKTIGGKAVGGRDLAAVLRRLIDGLNSSKALSVSNAWDGVQHTACQSLADELRASALAEIQKIKTGSALPPPVSRPLPVVDDELTKALKQSRTKLKAEWNARAVGDDAVKLEYWRELRDALAGEARELERLNADLAEKKLQPAVDAWAAWLSQDAEANAGDPRSEELAQLVDRGLPSKAVGRAVHEALHAARLSRIKLDGTVSALKAELDLRASADAAKSPAVATADTGDAALENTRELGRLQGQVQTLQEQAKEAIAREKALRTQILEAEEATRTEQRKTGDAQMRLREQEERLQTLQTQLEDERRQAVEKEARLPEDVAKAPAAVGAKQKCACNVM